jgi:cytidylate kinase
MADQVICISRSPGAGGEAVGQMVSKELGYRYVDEEIVSSAAAKLNVPVDLVADVESRKPLLGRLLRQVATDMANASMISGISPPREVTVDESDDHRELIRQAIYETAEKGRVVIVAHAASQLLAGRRGVLRILVTASPDTRVGRLTEDGQLGESAAKKLVAQGDLARADYLKRFYGIKRELPTHYDLVVNTDVVGLDEAAQIVLTACNR